MSSRMHGSHAGRHTWTHSTGQPPVPSSFLGRAHLCGIMTCLGCPALTWAKGSVGQGARVPLPRCRRRRFSPWRSRSSTARTQQIPINLLSLFWSSWVWVRVFRSSPPTSICQMTIEVKDIQITVTVFFFHYRKCHYPMKVSHNSGERLICILYVRLSFQYFVTDQLWMLVCGRIRIFFLTQILYKKIRIWNAAATSSQYSSILWYEMLEQRSSWSTEFKS